MKRCLLLIASVFLYLGCQSSQPNTEVQPTPQNSEKLVQTEEPKNQEISQVESKQEDSQHQQMANDQDSSSHQENFQSSQITENQQVDDPQSNRQIIEKIEVSPPVYENSTSIKIKIIKKEVTSGSTSLRFEKSQKPSLPEQSNPDLEKNPTQQHLVYREIAKPKEQKIVRDSLRDWSDTYDKILRRYVTPGQLNGIATNLVDYQGIRQDSRTEELYQQLKTIREDLVHSKTISQQLAFWINAYNFLVIYKITQNPGLKKLSDLDTPQQQVWDSAAGEIFSQTYSLNTIEHKIIRKNFQEPRIHFALVCAAVSCPKLRSEAFNGDALNEQLEDQLRSFAANGKKGLTVYHERKEIVLSQIFNWFKEDFQNDPKAWLINKKYLPESTTSYSVKFFDYDWNLNALPGKN